MLGSASPYTLCAEGDCTSRIARVVSVRPYTQSAEGISPLQQLLQISLFIKIGLHRLDNSRKDFAGRAVNRDIIYLSINHILSHAVQEMFIFIHTNLFHTTNQHTPHPASH